MNINTISVVIDRTKLLNALTYIKDVIDSRNVLTILSHFQLETIQDNLVVTGMDNETSVAVVLEAKVKTIGTLAVNSKTFYEMVKKAPETDITIAGDADNGKVQIKYNKSRFNSPCLNSEEFPALLSGTEVFTEINMKSLDFFNLINKARFASATEEIRYNMKCVYLKPGENNMLVSNATDGTAKCAIIYTHIPDMKDFAPVLIPIKAVDILCKVLKKPIENFKILIASTKIKFCYDNITITSKLIDGAFPDVDKIIPGGNDSFKVNITRADLLKAIERVQIVNSEVTHSIMLSFNHNVLTLSAKSEENGAGEEDVEIISNLEGFNIHLNSNFLFEIVSNINNDIIEMVFFNSSRVIRFNNPVNDKELYLLSLMKG